MRILIFCVLSTFAWAQSNGAPGAFNLTEGIKPAVYFDVDGIEYMIQELDVSITQSTAKEFCGSLGMVLPCFQDGGKFLFLERYLVNNGYGYETIWIGGEIKDSKWTWIPTNELFTFKDPWDTFSNQPAYSHEGCCQYMAGFSGSYFWMADFCDQIQWVDVQTILCERL